MLRKSNLKETKMLTERLKNCLGGKNSEKKPFNFIDKKNIS